MAKKKTADIEAEQMQLQSGANHSAMLKAVAKDVRDTVAIEQKRTALNEELALIRERVVSKGIPKHAFRAALAYYKMDQEKREGFDEGYALVREAVSLPFNSEPDMFEDNANEEAGEEGESIADFAARSEAAVKASAKAFEDEQAEGDAVLAEMAPSITH